MNEHIVTQYTITREIIFWDMVPTATAPKCMPQRVKVASNISLRELICVAYNTISMNVLSPNSDKNVDAKLDADPAIKSLTIFY